MTNIKLFFTIMREVELEPRLRKCAIRKSTFWIILICVILLLPDEFFSIVEIYYSGTPSHIRYEWLNYRFDIIQMLIVCVGFAFCIIKKYKGAFLFLVYFCIREWIYVLLGYDNIFEARAYEMYLVILVGTSLIVISIYFMKTIINIERLYLAFLLTNVLSIYIGVIRESFGLLARYNAVNLDVGATGVLCSISIIQLYFMKGLRFRCLWFVLSFIGLILSGSRISLLLLFLIGALLVIEKVVGEFGYIKLSVNLKNSLKLVALFFIIVIGVSVLGKYVADLFGESRWMSLSGLGSLSNDDSAEGRIDSLLIGLDVLKQNWLGISGYFVNLQSELSARGYPTFPHSGLLSAYLIYGPAVLILYGIWIKSLNCVYHRDKKYFWTILFLVIYNTFAGGPIVNFKVIFLFGIPTVVIWKLCQNRNGWYVAKKMRGFAFRERKDYERNNLSGGIRHTNVSLNNSNK